MTGTLLSLICLLSALLYLSAFITLLFAKKLPKYLPNMLWIAALIMNVVIVANNWIVNGYMPFVSMYQVLTFLGVTFSLVYVYIRYMHGGEFMKKYFIASQAVIMIGVFFMSDGSVWHFPPALRSPYFIPHVFSYMISYALVAVSAIMCITRLFRAQKERTLYENGIYRLVLTGFPFMVLGLFLGALWANACWGEYWSWDNKEVWSLVTVLSLSVYLHFRRQEKLKKYAHVFVILAFVFEIITLFFVGMFGGNSVHTYN